MKPNHPSLLTFRKGLAIALLGAVGLTGSLVAQPAPGTPVVPGAPGAPGLPPGMVPGGPIAPATTYSPGRVISMEPDAKRALVLQQAERNPYADRSEDEEVLTENGANAEELEIRAQLSALAVTGRSIGPKGPRVLLGDLILEKDRILPPILPEQSDDLKVTEVGKDSITLSWLDAESGEPTGKEMQLSYDLTPAVSYALSGQRPAAGENVAELRMGVMKVNQERAKLREQQIAEDDRPSDLSPETFQAGQ